MEQDIFAMLGRLADEVSQIRQALLDGEDPRLPTDSVETAALFEIVVDEMIRDPSITGDMPWWTEWQLRND